MDVQQSSRSMTSMLKAAVGVKDKEQNGTNAPRGPVKSSAIIGHDPQLSAYIVTRALKSPQGVSFTDLARALLDAKDRSDDKNFRSNLPGLLLRLSFYETLPSDVISRLVPLFQMYAKDLRVLRSLFYLCGLHISRGSAGTPTLVDSSSANRGPTDVYLLQAIIAEAVRMLQAPATDPAVKRAAAFLLGTAGRASEPARKEALTAIEHAVSAADVLASASSGINTSNSSNKPVSSATNWELQHTVFGSLRIANIPATGVTDITSACFLGIGSPDAAGARHALALAAEIALRDPALVIHEMADAVGVSADIYEANGPSPPTLPGQGIHTGDTFCRLYLARTCAHVLHSDQSASDPTRGGAPFWRMLCLLCTRDPSDVVRFGALEALTGSIVSTTGAQIATATTKTSGPREDAMAHQRRARAWRLLVARADTPVSVPGIAASPQDGTAKNTASGTGDTAASSTPPPSLKLIMVVGRLLVLALSKPERAARFCVAASAASSLAESCLVSQSSGTSRHISSPDIDKVMTILADELGSLLESPLTSVQHCICVEGLLYLQASGYPTALSPAKLLQTGSGKGGGGAGSSIQDSLLTAVLKCAKAKPQEAPAFLCYASGIVGISPSSADLGKVTELWSASITAIGNGSRDGGRDAALAAALAVLRSPPPPSTRSSASADHLDVVRASREDAGWVSFVSTAIWWLGENANTLCGEFVGKKVYAPVVPSKVDTVDDNDNDDKEEEKKKKIDDDDDTTNDDTNNTNDKAPASLLSHRNVIERQSTRNPTLSNIIASLHDVVLTATWQLRACAARAIATIAVRSGEPFRLKCYSILASCAISGSRGEDALGLHSVVDPVLNVLDSIYATQATLDDLWRIHGDDVEGWPPEIISSLSRRSSAVRSQVERTICAVPKHVYALLGHRAVAVLAHAEEEGPAYASFLSSDVIGSAAAAAGTTNNNNTGASNRRGGSTGVAVLAATKNREVEDILSFGGSDNDSLSFGGGAFHSDTKTQKKEEEKKNKKEKRNSTDTTKRIDNDASDRDRQIENMLSGAVGISSSDPWAFTPSHEQQQQQQLYALGNEHATTTTTAAAAAATSSSITTYNDDDEDDDPFGSFKNTSTPRNGDAYDRTLDRTASGISDDRGATTTTITTATTTTALPNEGTARVIGTGSMLHTFIADSRNPEEISIFEGDKVDVLEDIDGWLLIRDPHGSQGLVPTAYVHLEHVYGGGPARNNNNSMRNISGGDVWGNTSGVNSPSSLSATHSLSDGQRTAQHAKGMSLDFSAEATNEDYLDRFFTGGAAVASPRASSTPSGHSPTAWQAVESPVGTARTGGGGGNPFSMLASASVIEQQGVGVGGSAVQNAATNAQQQQQQQYHHRRVTSSASSSHQRTLSNSSDLYSSMPGTPSRIEGPERNIIAAFNAEMEGELSVDVGDKVKVHSEVGGWARVLRISDMNSGLIPSWAVNWND